ncbi:MAG: lipid-A-disaccharide synthase [Deltaproteobacteria bacterium]|nr:lipid-A-disaccharide synthase [Deltaproteobacteria bacterium]
MTLRSAPPAAPESCLRDEGGCAISIMPDSREKHILIVAGEASGDLHGAALVRAIKKLDQGIAISGIGGRKMEEAGVHITAQSSDIAVVGLTEVFSKLKKIIKAHGDMRSLLKNAGPDLLILIDFPDFNISLARTAVRYKVPVLYYISPQVWAWRSGRVKKIAKRVDKMAVILPFEKDFYMKSGADIDVEYVGHPVMDAIPERPDRETISTEMGLGSGRPVIGLLPGSRTDEINNLLPCMIGAAEMLSSRYPGMQCILPLAPTISHELVQSFIDMTTIKITVSQSDIYSALSACDLVLAASGTVTLEAAVMGVPMVVAYRVSPLSFAIGKMVINVSHVSIANLIAGREIVPELLQDKATPLGLADRASMILDNKDYRENMIAELAKVRESLGGKGASDRTAMIAVNMINSYSRER